MTDGDATHVTTQTPAPLPEPAEVRAATRFPRRTAVGLLARDDVLMAAYPCVAVLAVT